LTVKKFTTRHTPTTVDTLNWNPFLKQQLAAIFEAKFGPVFGPECDDEPGEAPIKCQVPRNIDIEDEDDGDEWTTTVIAKGSEAAGDDGWDNPINGHPEGPMFGPEGQDGGWDSPIKCQSHRAPEDPTTDSIVKQIINGDEKDYGPDWDAPMKYGKADSPTYGDEDERDGAWSLVMRIDEDDAPIFGPDGGGEPGWQLINGKDDDEDAAIKCSVAPWQTQRGREDEEDAAIKCSLFGNGITPIRELVAC
jgi:hypothetical protein